MYFLLLSVILMMGSSINATTLGIPSKGNVFFIKIARRENPEKYQPESTFAFHAVYDRTEKGVMIFHRRDKNALDPSVYKIRAAEWKKQLSHRNGQIWLDRPSVPMEGEWGYADDEYIFYKESSAHSSGVNAVPPAEHTGGGAVPPTKSDAAPPPRYNARAPSGNRSTKPPGNRPSTPPGPAPPSISRSHRPLTSTPPGNRPSTPPFSSREKPSSISRSHRPLTSTPPGNRPSTPPGRARVAAPPPQSDAVPPLKADAVSPPGTGRQPEDSARSSTAKQSNKGKQNKLKRNTRQKKQKRQSMMNTEIAIAVMLSVFASAMFMCTCAAIICFVHFFLG